MHHCEQKNIENITFDFYFDRLDYVLTQGRGISVFNADQELIDRFLDRISGETEVSVWWLSSIVAHPPEDIPDSPHVVVIIQDLKVADLEAHAATAADKIIFPLWFNGVSICFFSFLPQSKYQTKRIRSSDIHRDLSRVNNYLLREQIFRLLERVNYQFSSPEFLALSEHKTIYTPIEEKILQALEKNGLDYQAQVRLGDFYVDFLVDVGKGRAIVECDGRAYHDPAKDRERDKQLSTEGYEIFRFTGSEINADAAQCVETVIHQVEYRTSPAYQLDPDLDSSQLKAVEISKGPVRVLAPAGSGKTKTLVNRIFYLLNQGVQEESLLALAFNRKAREEMQSRLARRGASAVDVRTFHSLGYEIVRRELGWEFRGKQYQKTTRQLLRKAIERHISLPRRRNSDPLDAFLDGLSRVKMELPRLAEVEIEFEDKVYPFEKIFNSYLKEQTRSNFLTFNDMIYLALRILIKNDLLRKEYQERFEYVLVDEYQDLNKAQLMLLQILALPQNNIFAVGDDDQLIYGWRGAEVRQIIDFGKRFPLAKSHVLKTNYRSSKEVIKHAKWLISQNNDRVQKDIQPCPGAAEGLFEIYGDESVLCQAQHAVEWLLKHQEKTGRKWSDYAFLYRYNALQFPLALILGSKGIPHTPLSGQHIFESQVAKDLLAYLGVILYPREARKEDCRRILNRPNKYLKNEIVNQVTSWSSLQALTGSPNLRDWERDKIIDFVVSLEYIRDLHQEGKLSAKELLNYLVSEIDLRKFYQNHSRMADEADASSDEIMMDVLLSLAENFDTPGDFYQYAIKTSEDFYYAQKKNRAPSEQRSSHDRDEVYLSTVYKAKGKEFASVVYFNLSEEGKAKRGTDEEEERRVVYVGATRAIENLLVTYPKEEPSRFLFDLVLNPEFSSYEEQALQNELEKIRKKLELMETKARALQQELIVTEEKTEKLNSLLEEGSFWRKFILTNRLIQWRLDRIMTAQEKVSCKDNRLLKEKIIPMKELIRVLEEEISFRETLISE